ncbi:MAG: SH3 domain-containing protein [Thermomicrobia bacterium]|nr:SH3 domain-containing protein [Thermomicrobia bacterium]
MAGISSHPQANLAITWFVGVSKFRGGSSATATPNGTTTAASAAASTRATGGSVVAGSARPVGTAGAGVITPSGVAGIPNGQATLPAGTSTGGTPAAGTGSSPSLPIRRFTVSAGGSGANMRTNPDTKSNPPIATIQDGTEVQVVDGPQTGADGIPWYKVSAGDKTGWIRSDFLKPVTP